MSDSTNLRSSKNEHSSVSPPVTRLVFMQEFKEIWVGGRVFTMLIVFSVLMSVTAFLLATNNEVQLMPMGHVMVTSMLAAITFGLFIGLIIAAESISGERERATLEVLLLTPANRRNIVLGKFLAALSPWPVALILTLPYVAVLAKGDPIFGQTIFYGSILGSLLAIAFICLGMLLSILSDSSRISLSVSLLVYVLALIPAQLPTEFQETPTGIFIASIDPLESTRLFLTKTLTGVATPSELWLYLAAPFLCTVILLGILFIYVAPRIGLEGGKGNIKLRALKPSKAID